MEALDTEWGRWWLVRDARLGGWVAVDGEMVAMGDGLSDAEARVVARAAVGRWVQSRERG